MRSQRESTGGLPHPHLRHFLPSPPSQPVGIFWKGKLRLDKGSPWPHGHPEAGRGGWDENWSVALLDPGGKAISLTLAWTLPSTSSLRSAYFVPGSLPGGADVKPKCLDLDSEILALGSQSGPGRIQAEPIMLGRKERLSR